MAETATKPKRWGMVIDLERCIGCWTCAVACKSNNNVPMGTWWNRILTVGQDIEDIDVPSGEYPDLRLVHMPYACFQCDEAPCVQVCPVSATYKREDGIVMMDYDRCIGCRYCLVACPYNNRVFNWEVPQQIPANTPTYHVGAQEKRSPRPKGVAEKCDFCFQRVDAGQQPFCIEVCPARARFFGDLDDPNSDVATLIRTRPTMRVREDLGAEPKVYYIPRTSGGTVLGSLGVDPERRNLDGTVVPQVSAWDGHRPSVDPVAMAAGRESSNLSEVAR